MKFLTKLRACFLAGLLWLVAAPAWAAFGTPVLLGFAASSGSGSTVGYTLTAGQARAVGDLVVGQATYLGTVGSGNPTSCSDNAAGSTNVYALGPSVGGSTSNPGLSKMVWSVLTTAIPDGTVITCTYNVSNSTTKQLYFAAVSGVSTIDLSLAGAQATGTNPTIAISGAADNREIIFTTIREASVNVTAGPGGCWNDFALPNTLVISYCITSSNGAINPAWTAASGTYTIQAMSFRERIGGRNRPLTGVGQ